MFETIIFLIHQLTYAINQIDFLAFVSFSIFTIAGCLFHEFGHILVARFYGIKKAKIFFKRLPNSKMRLPLFFVDIDDDLLMRLPRHKRKAIYLGGFIIDVLVGSFALIYAANCFLENSIEIGIVLAGVCRFLISWVNLIPVSSIKSDGWRLMNPDAL
jgi:membrane-associated protease RseP (regulator of RpoE activity)